MFWAWLYYHRFDLLLGTLLIFILIGPYIEYDLGPINVPHVLIMTINVAAVGAARGTRRHLPLSWRLSSSRFPALLCRTDMLGKSASC